MRSRTAFVVAFLVVLSTISLPRPATATVNSFIDDDTSRFEPFIEAARENGLVRGCNPPANDRVCPHALVSRENLAIMLARAVDAPATDLDFFTDDDGDTGEGSINALVAAGVPMGCDVESFCPDQPVRRGEMAALITRAFRLTGAPAPNRYRDTADSPFASELTLLAENGALLPCDPPLNTRLCPGATVRKDEAVFAIVSAMGLDPAPVTPRQTETTPIGFGDSFDELSLWDGRSPSSRNRVGLTDNGYHDSALRVTIPKGSHYGADFHLHLEDAAAEEPQELFFRYYLRLDSDWATTSGGKLPGFSGIYGSSGKGGYESSPSNPGWSARLMFSATDEEDSRAHLGYYVYHLGQETRYGDRMGWNEAGRLQPGEWYCLEGEVDLNTLGLADGALRAWVDGTPAFDMSGLEFRRPDEPAIKIESFWFNVYYGGKAVAPHDLGLTIDEVMVDTQRIGCAGGHGATMPTTGDFDGNGIEDRLWWGKCSEGTCFWLKNKDAYGSTTTRTVGDGGWFSLDTQRLGLSSGDVDGDGSDDLVYRGRCDDSQPCWRVHRTSDVFEATGENWGDGARLADATSTLTLGDWNGDGRDDLAYQSICGGDDHDCWRVHMSTGTSFDPPQDWGHTPDTVVVADSADLDGDGLDDLLYQAPCGKTTCWFVQISTGTSFTDPRNVGPTTDTERDHFELLDFDSSGTSDLLAWTSGPRGTLIEVRYLSDGSLTEPVTLVALDRPVADVLLFRPPEGGPVQALIDTKCGDGSPCRARLFATPGRELTDPASYRSRALQRLGLPSIT
jgi:hypothetical protein